MSVFSYLANKLATRKQQQALSILNKQAHLRILAEQLSPHFVFNTLNNLRFMLILDQLKAQKMALDISDIVDDLDTITHENNISLATEVSFTEKYLRLLNIQLGDEYTLKLTLTKSVQQLNTINVLPMILQLLAENAVKHGLNNVNSGKLLIQLKCYKRYLIYRVTNTSHVKKANLEDGITKLTTKESTEKAKHSLAIGINNILQRLAIIYPNQHSFRLKKGAITSTLIIFPMNIETEER